MATSAHEWLTKMIKARLLLSKLGFTRCFVVAGTGFESLSAELAVTRF